MKEQLARLGEEVLAEEVPDRLLKALIGEAPPAAESEATATSGQPDPVGREDGDEDGDDPAT
ncbi:hypothetical protein [Afifella pfennigii]|uniref:hypothetical protein n=1 Tax=Afifella pfennigii TaxID=209897 RepID=UPI00047D9BBC|nr:hypothetical protein [Afifella pfennigii]